MLFVALPAGSHDLNMLIVVQRPPEGVSTDETTENKGVEQLVEEKVVRISMLQQIAKSTADVVEPEIVDENNYQDEQPVSDKTYRWS